MGSVLSSSAATEAGDAQPMRRRSLKPGGPPRLQKEPKLDICKVVNDAQLHEFREAFAMFDRDGSGAIDKCELRGLLERFGREATDDEVDQMFRMADVSGDGTIGFWEVSKPRPRFLLPCAARAGAFLHLCACIPCARTCSMLLLCAMLPHFVLSSISPRAWSSSRR